MTTSPDRGHEQIGTFFAANADRLHATVCARVRAPEQTIEDACQAAWTILLRCPYVTLDERGLSWLVTVATREAWRLASIADETPVGSFRGTPGHDGELPEPPAPDDRSAEQRALAGIDHDERVAVLRTLKPREREALYLQGLGYSYDEIAKLSQAPRVAVGVVAAVDRRRHVADAQ